MRETFDGIKKIPHPRPSPGRALRKLRSSCLEGRTALIQPIVNFLTGSDAGFPLSRAASCPMQPFSPDVREKPVLAPKNGRSLTQNSREIKGLDTISLAGRQRNFEMLAADWQRNLVARIVVEKLSYKLRFLLIEQHLSAT
jgi:hypothetical protein